MICGALWAETLQTHSGDSWDLGPIYSSAFSYSNCVLEWKRSRLHWHFRCVSETISVCTTQPKTHATWPVFELYRGLWGSPLAFCFVFYNGGGGGGSVCLCVPQMTYFLRCHPGRCANRACSRWIVLLTSSLHNFLVKPKLIKLPCVLFAMVAIWC